LPKKLVLGKPSRKLISFFLNLMQKYFDRLIDFCLRHPYGVMGVAVVSVVAGMGLITILPQKMMPTSSLCWPRKTLSRA